MLSRVRTTYVSRIVACLCAVASGCGNQSDPADAASAGEVAGAGPDAGRDSSRDIPQREVPPPARPSGPVAPWTSANLGAVALNGDVDTSGSLITVRAAGTGIGGVADSFHFLSQKVTGDFELLARVRSLQAAERGSNAGIMVRAGDADAAAANIFLTVVADPMVGGQLQVRSSAGGDTRVLGPDPGVRAGQWLRITRRGRTFTAARSMTRLDWTKVGSADLDLPADLSVGVATASGNAARPTVVELDGLRVNGLPGQASTRDWTLDEIATMGGSATWTDGSLTVHGRGEQLSLLGETGVLVFTPAGGNQVLTARVASFTHSDPGAHVDLMIRQGPPVLFQRTQPAVVLSLTAGLGISFSSRAMTNLMATVTPALPGVQAPLWLRLERIEQPGPPLTSRFVGSYSLDGSQWTTVGEASFPMPEPFLIGIGASSDGSRTPVRASFADLSLVTAASPPPDAGPLPDARDGAP
jgi:regulation of enolase protein 1 (concanavalin A-like superfamily)